MPRVGWCYHRAVPARDTSQQAHDHQMRLYRAIWSNHRYWFTTWRWGRIVAALLLMGEALKFALLS